MDLPLGLIVGVGLAASCGFRVFVPLLVMSIAAASGNLHLASGFEWIGSPVAVVAFGAATALEIAAYYIPAVDNLLDTIATPAAVVAGTVAMAACVQDTSPFLTWSLAAIVGGGSAATVQGLTTVTRLASTTATGGLGNHLVATGEAGGSVALAGLTLASPVLGLIVVVLLVGWTLRTAWRFFGRRKARRAAAAMAQGASSMAGAVSSGAQVIVPARPAPPAPPLTTPAMATAAGEPDPSAMPATEPTPAEGAAPGKWIQLGPR